MWTIPGGQIEAGEDVVDALVREVGEETGLTVLDPGRLAFVSEADDPGAGWSASLSTWDVASWSGEVKQRDPDCYVLEAAWKPLEAAVELLSRIAWHPLTVRYLRGELEAGSRWRGRVGGEWSALEP